MHRAEWTFLVIFTLVATILAAGSSSYATLQTRTHQFDSEASRIQAIILESLGSSRGLIIAMGTLYRANENIDASSFSLIASDIQATNPAIRHVAFAPRLPSNNLEAFETMLREEGFPTFSVKTQAGTRNQVDSYLPLVFIEPFGPVTARFMGEDLLGRPELTEAIQSSIVTNEPQLVYLEHFLDSTLQLGFLHPVYSGTTTPRSALERETHLRGLLVFTLDPKQWKTGADIDVKNLIHLNFSKDDNNEQILVLNDPQLDLRDSLLSLEKTLLLPHFPLSLYIRKPVGYTEIINSPIPYITLLGAIIGFIISRLIITRRRVVHQEQAAKAELFRIRRHAETTLQSIGDAVITVDSYLIIRSANTMAEQLLGRSGTDLIGMPADQVIKLTDESSGRNLALFDLREHDLSRNHIILNRADSAHIPIEIDIRHLHGGHEEDMGQVIVLRDVSTERELSQELHYQATHDPLTDLMNRYAFDQELQASLKSAHRRDSHHVLCYLDLDQFKLINDTCGHMAGDIVLKQISSIIHSQLRAQDIIARLGGDEFGIILSDCPLKKAQEIAERIRLAVRDFRFPWEEKVFDLRVSIGLVPITENAQNMTELLSAADIACYSAKERGRDQVYAYLHDDESITERHGEMQWLPILQEALREDHFSMALQPIVPIENDSLPEIYEFLIRLNRPDDQSNLPGSFLPAAERYDLMREIDTWVINHCFGLIASYSLPDKAHFSINLSGQSLTDPQLPTRILQAQEQFKIDPDRIYFEITETSAITNLAATIELINRLRTQGYHFALDDFGSGFSSYSYLSRLPIDLLKIDGQFIRDIRSNKINYTLVKGIREIAEVLDVASIAEFVENSDIVGVITSMGIEYMQGFHCGKPRPAEHILSEISS
jgi:diguanylate cyclase (GGDEF)-like protein/PAS domain S-box-containing protein